MAGSAWRSTILSFCLLWTASTRADRLKVHVIYSQHLDVGFNSATEGVVGTDEAAINVYFDRHFPGAVATAEAFRKQTSTRSYKWMAHAWLISLYFDCPVGMGLHCPSPKAKEAMAAAIKRGDIYWHALPFNGQPEFFDAALLEYSAFFVHQVDDQFHLPHKTVVSLRDVPGMTRAAIPLLNRQGIVGLSQGVNGASAPPGLPKNQLIIWSDPTSGGQLVVWVHPGGYSGSPQDQPLECVSVNGFDHVICHAWKEDNQGPHSYQEASKIFDFYEEEFPGAEVFASTFDNYMNEVQAVLPSLRLPTFSGEIGDSWVYGIPSDARKVSRYLAALRLRAAMTWRYDDYAFFNFSRLLMKVGEHTWGSDTKTTISDYTNWSNQDFHALLHRRAKNFEDAVYSWKRQAKYVDWALEALGLTPDDLADQLPMGLPEQPALENYSETFPRQEFATDSWVLSVDPETGGLSRLQRRWEGGEAGLQWASAEIPLGQVVYDTFVEDDYKAIFDHYIYSEEALKWARLDFGKPNCTKGKPRRSSSTPMISKMWVKQDGDAVDLLLQSSLPEWTWREAGAPQQLWTRIHSSSDDSLYIDITLKTKTPTRLPEAMWVKFAPNLETADPQSWLMYKLGQPVSPLHVMLNGSQSQHAVSQEGVSVQSQPTPLATREVLTVRYHSRLILLREW